MEYHAIHENVYFVSSAFQRRYLLAWHRFNRKNFRDQKHDNRTVFIGFLKLQTSWKSPYKALVNFSVTKQKLWFYAVNEQLELKDSTVNPGISIMFLLQIISVGSCNVVYSNHEQLELIDKKTFRPHFPIHLIKEKFRLTRRKHLPSQWWVNN